MMLSLSNPYHLAFSSVIGAFPGVFYEVKTQILGLSWDHIGAQCGFISLAIIVPLVLYWTVELSIKIVKVHKEGKPYRQTLMEAGFGHVTLLAERHNKDDINLYK